MKAGKVFVCDPLELKAHLVAAVAGTDVTVGAAFRATTESTYTPDGITMNRGIYLGCYTSQGGSGGPITVSEHKYRLHIPDIPYDQTVVGGAAFKSPMDTHIEADAFTVYVMASGVWRVKWTELRWYIEGILEDTIGAQTFDAGILTPASVPLIGIPARLHALAAVDVSLQL